MSAPLVGPRWPGLGPVLNAPTAPYLDLDEGVAQRQATFRFELTNGVTGERLGDITPIRDASLSTDSNSVTKRQLSFPLGLDDTAAINPLTDRVSPFMVIPSTPCPDTTSGDWPLGRYMWADESRAITSRGPLGSEAMVDEMLRVDQPILAGISGVGKGVVSVIFAALSGLNVDTDVEASPYTSADSWGIGAGRGGEVLSALAVAGDYFSPWFGNDTRLHFIRTFDPADKIPDIDLDVGSRVIRSTILQTGDVLTAPNTVVVISNNATDASTPCVGIATVPPTAPNSVTNRGFALPVVFNLQLADVVQAKAVANGLMQRLSISQQITLSTPPDPRHDAYNVIRWQGFNWLELGWSMQLVEGAEMTHVLRRQHAA